MGLLEVGANAEAVTPGGIAAARGGVGCADGAGGGGGASCATRRERAKPLVASPVEGMKPSRSAWSVRQSGYRALRSFARRQSRMDWIATGRLGTLRTAGMAAS